MGYRPTFGAGSVTVANGLMALGDLLTIAPAALVDNRASAREEEDFMLVRNSPTGLIRGFEEGRGQKPVDEIDQVARGLF